MASLSSVLAKLPIPQTLIASHPGCFPKERMKDSKREHRDRCFLHYGHNGKKPSDERIADVVFFMPSVNERPLFYFPESIVGIPESMVALSTGLPKGHFHE